MFQMLRLELKKALRHKLFLIVVLLGTAIMLGQVIYNAISYQGILEDIAYTKALYGENVNVTVHANTLFNRWIGAEQFSLFFSIFFFLFPILAVIPYGWSYFQEEKTGYIKNIVIRTKKSHYFFAKYMAVFLSGGIAVALPLLLNFLGNAMIFPAVTPDPSQSMYYFAFEQKYFLSELFYSHPFLFVFLFLCIIFVFCGLIAATSLTLTFLVKKIAAILLVPPVLLIGWHILCGALPMPFEEYEFSPLNFLHPTANLKYTSGWIFLLEGLILLIFTFGICMYKGNKNEIY